MRSTSAVSEDEVRHRRIRALVAILDRDEKHHAWGVYELGRLALKMISSEAVHAEVHFLTQDLPEEIHRIESRLADGGVELPFTVRDHHSLIHELMAHCANVPMSLADAYLLRMFELWPVAPSSCSTPTSTSIAVTSANHCH